METRINPEGRGRDRVAGQAAMKRFLEAVAAGASARPPSISLARRSLLRWAGPVTLTNTLSRPVQKSLNSRSKIPHARQRGG